MNLIDRNNPDLKIRVLTKDISAKELASMSASDMASEQLRQLTQQTLKDNINAARVANDTSAETDQFKCGKCKQRKTKYFQMQTRSADEPMTTFVTCLVCNNRWKFC